MLPSDRRLDESTLQDVLVSGHSRVPVHEPGNRYRGGGGGGECVCVWSWPSGVGVSLIVLGFVVREWAKAAAADSVCCCCCVLCVMQAAAAGFDPCEGAGAGGP